MRFKPFHLIFTILISSVQAFFEIQTQVAACDKCKPTECCASFMSLGKRNKQCLAKTSANRMITMGGSYTFLYCKAPVKCPDYTYHQPARYLCEGDQCNLRQKLNINGKCENCPDYKRMQTPGNVARGWGRVCAPDKCKPNQKIVQSGSLGGTCTNCPDYQLGKVPSLFECYKPSCLQRQKLMKNGSCFNCPDYERMQGDGTKSLQGITCGPDKCGPRQRLNKDDKNDGGRCFNCDPYTRAQDSNKKCGPNLCTGIQKLIIDGTCENCPPYKRMQGPKTSSFQGQNCGPDTCSDTQRVVQLGTLQGRCTNCASYQRSPDKRTCRPDDCNDMQKLLPNGRCQQCPPWTRSVGKTNRVCKHDYCTSNQIQTRQGTCKACQTGYTPKLTQPNKNRECVKKIDPCDQNRYILIDGSAYKQQYNIQKGIKEIVSNVSAFYKYSKPECTVKASDIEYRLQGAPAAFSLSGMRLTVDTDNKQLKGQTYTFSVIANHRTKSYSVSKQVQITIIEKPPIPPCPQYQRRPGGPGTHYILMLDGSGSMSRAGRWTELIQEVEIFFKQHQSSASNMKVSTIIYDNLADIVFEHKVPDIELLKKISYTGFGTNFELPLNQAYKLAKKYQSQSTEVVLYFLSDGSAAYPSNAISQIKNDPSLYNKVRFESIGFGQQDFGVLQQMANAFAPKGKMTRAIDRADLRKSFKDLAASSVGKNGCRPDPCNKQRQILLVDGTCQTCKQYEKPQNPVQYGYQTFCRADYCAPNQQLLPNGTCKTCPTGHIVSANKYNCIEVICKRNEKKLSNGTCVCVEYTRKLPSGLCGDTCSYREKVLTTGYCAECSRYYRRADTRITCIQDNCYQDQIHDVNGYCKYCKKLTVPDPTQKLCIPKVCPANKPVLNPSTAICETCRVYTRFGYVQGSGSSAMKCRADTCNPRQILTKNGTCLQCNNFTRPQGSLTEGFHTVCKADTCYDNQILLISGTCQNCEKFTKPNPEKRMCIQIVCSGARQYLNDSARCVDCPWYTKPSPDKRKCVAPTCDKYSKLTQYGVCERCPKCTKADYAGKSCERERCNLRSIGMIDGTCKQCPNYYRPVDGVGGCGKVCQKVTCNFQNQFVTFDGLCQDCPPYHHPHASGRSCVLKLCASGFIVTQEGRCEKCRPCSRVSPDGRSCLQDRCNSRSILLSDGRCQTCRDYQLPVPSGPVCGSKCVDVKCNRNQRVTREGLCETCKPCSRVSANGKYCEQDTCTSNFVLNEQGRCDMCPKFYASRPSSTTCGRSCQKVTCPANNIITVQGTCDTCRSCFKASPDQRTCAQPSCPTNSIVQPDGSCSACPPYKVARSFPGRCGICESPQCGAGKILTSDGRCQACRPCTRPSFDKRYCEQDRCASNQIVREDGTCRTCPDYMIPTSTAYICGKSCEVPKCGAKQIVTRRGACAPCGMNEYVSPDGRRCLEYARCGYRQYRDSMGNCIKCQAYMVLNRQGTGCTRAICQAGYRVQLDGSCAMCPRCTQISPDQRSCTTRTCSRGQVLMSDGTCGSCPAYFKPRTVAGSCGAVCERITCGTGSIVTASGLCQECGPGMYASRDGRRCYEKERCRGNAYRDDYGTCQSCPPGQQVSKDLSGCDKKRCRGDQIERGGICISCGPREMVSPDGQRCIERQRCPRYQYLDQYNRCQNCPRGTFANSDGKTCSR